jgi:hypothetical protein
MKLNGIGRRQAILTIALLLTLAATAYVWHNDQQLQNEASQIVAPVKVNIAQTGQQNMAAVPIKQSIPQKKPRAQSEVTRDIFAVRKTSASEQKSAEAQAPIIVPKILPKLEPLPTLPALTAPPPPALAPTAPPLPFKYIGKLGDDGQYTVFLSAQNKNYAVKLGDTVIQTYRVDEIKPPVMILTYLPTNTKQNMQIGEAN